MQGNDFAPFFAPPAWSQEARWALTPFVTSLEESVYSFRSHLLPPQLLGALFSRASRAKGDLREILWNEYFSPILHADEQTEENVKLAAELKEIIDFHYAHQKPPYNTERAYHFFAKWLAQYGDDSIAQMASTNLVAAGLSQPAIKFLEDQRVGVSPIEKSTRYVDYGVKLHGRYLYYTDPRFAEWGLKEEYEQTMDSLFGAYSEQLPLLIDKLQLEYPEEKRSVLEKKAFDILRGLLPLSALSQVAFHGNAQAFKYMIDRCAEHSLGELRWFAKKAREALDQEIPALLLRLDDEVTREYQKELADRKTRIRQISQNEFRGKLKEQAFSKPEVRLAEYDPEGENKVITGLLFSQAPSGASWDAILQTVRQWPAEKKEEALKAHFAGRKARWQKVGRAFENAFVRFEIVMNIGSYRDLHRHRMHTQDRQLFTTELGYEISDEMKQYGLAALISQKMEETSALCQKIAERDPDAAQYAPAMSHFVRFYQYQNLRQFFWEAELRTISQGRPDYRWIEQEKYRLLQNAYPLIVKYALIDMNQYDLARRGTEEKIQQKEEQIIQHFSAP